MPRARFVIALCAACVESTDDSPGPATPSSTCPAQAGDSPLRFTDISGSVGLPSEPAADCALVIDIDRDGFEDIAVGLPQCLLVYWGEGGGRFRQTVVSRTPNPGGCLAVDLDGNGLRDLVFPANSPGALAWQVEPRRFEAAHLPASTDPRSEPSRTAVAADFDGDGRLDLLLGRLGQIALPATCTPRGGHVTCHAHSVEASGDQALLNAGEGRIRGCIRAIVAAAPRQRAGRGLG